TCSRCASSSSTGWCRDSNPIPANRAPCICALSSTGSPCTHCTARIQTEPSVHYGPTCDTLRSRKRSPTTSPYERAGNGHERVHVVSPEHPGRARREISAQRRHHEQPSTVAASTVRARGTVQPQERIELSGRRLGLPGLLRAG